MRSFLDGQRGMRFNPTGMPRHPIDRAQFGCTQNTEKSDFLDFFWREHSENATPDDEALCVDDAHIGCHTEKGTKF